MAIYTCPKCGNTLKRGSWEIFSQCPECGAAWPVEAGAAAFNVKKVQFLAVLFTALCFIPYLGIVFGAFGVFWGGLAVKFRRVALGTALMLISAVVGLAVQPAFAWWQLGQLSNQKCLSDLRGAADSLRVYQVRHGALPGSLEMLTKDGLALPERCLSGGVYVYLRPEQAATMAAAVESAAATMPASGDDSSRLLMCEALAGHRYERMCVTADLAVRSISHREFETLLAAPQNAAFAKLLAEEAEAAKGKNKKAQSVVETRPASQPATSLGPDSPVGPPTLKPPAGTPRDASDATSPPSH